MNEEHGWPPGTVAKIDWQDAHGKGQSRVLARADDGFWLPILDETSPAAIHFGLVTAVHPLTDIERRVRGLLAGVGAMRADKPMSGRLAPPDRPAVCAHDVRGPLRQACCCCGACDHLDFRVTDEAWSAVVPKRLNGGHICLRCFDALAAERGVDYADALTELCFVGDAAVLSFRPVSAVSVI